MTITIKLGSEKADMNKALKSIKKKRKGFDADKHFGKVKWDIDGLAYQKKIKDEWKQ